MDVRKYQKDGYIVERGVLFPHKVSALSPALKGMFARQTPEVPPNTLIETLVQAKERSSDQFFSTLLAFTRLLEVQKFISATPIRLAIEELFRAQNLIAHQPVLSVLSERLRTPGGYFGTTPHQDWPSLQGSLDAVVVWVPLTDASPGNYPLQVVPGSHLSGVIKGDRDGSVMGLEQFTDADFVTLDTKPDDIVFLSAFTVHRTGPSFSPDAFRAALSTRYENPYEPTFVERGYPCAQKRTTSYTSVTPDFPTVEQVRGVFGYEG